MEGAYFRNFTVCNKLMVNHSIIFSSQTDRNYSGFCPLPFA